jgi:hypothetical protein
MHEPSLSLLFVVLIVVGFLCWWLATWPGLWPRFELVARGCFFICALIWAYWQIGSR